MTSSLDLEPVTELFFPGRLPLLRDAALAGCFPRRAIGAYHITRRRLRCIQEDKSQALGLSKEGAWSALLRVFDGCIMAPSRFYRGVSWRPEYTSH